MATGHCPPASICNLSFPLNIFPLVAHPPMRPKARGLAQHGGPPGWLKESDPAGCDCLVVPYRLLWQQLPSCELITFPAALILYSNCKCRHGCSHKWQAGTALYVNSSLLTKAPTTTTFILWAWGGGGGVLSSIM
jgi:hypothetical protein